MMDASLLPSRVTARLDFAAARAGEDLGWDFAAAPIRALRWVFAPIVFWAFALLNLLICCSVIVTALLPS